MHTVKTRAWGFACRSLAIFLLGISTVRASDDLSDQLRRTKWISFAPTAYDPNRSPPLRPSVDSLRLDLTTLRSAGFTGLITYGATLDAVPRIAEAVGFTHMLLGVWDPFDTHELEAAANAVRDHSRLVTGIIVGNEGVMNGRYSVDDVCAVLMRVRDSTRKPVSTTEPVDLLLSERNLANCSTFITVNAHPFFSGHKRPSDAVQWTVEAWAALRGQYSNKPMLLKEVGLPTLGDESLSEAAQKDYYMRLATTPVIFAYFEAFDSLFKEGPVEQSWGLWRADRSPKAIVRSLPWRREGRQ